MKTNATFRYSNPMVIRSNGYIVREGVNRLSDAGECYADKASTPNRIYGEGGMSFSYEYEVYIPIEYKDEISEGSILQITFEDGTIVEKVVKSVENLNKVLSVWL